MSLLQATPMMANCFSILGSLKVVSYYGVINKYNYLAKIGLDEEDYELSLKVYMKMAFMGNTQS